MTAATRGDLTGRSNSDSPDEVGELGRTYDALLDAVSGLLSTVSTNSQAFHEATEDLEVFGTQMNISAEESSSQAELVAAAAEQVSVNVQTVAAAMEEMSASIHEIARSTSDVAAVASSAVTVVDEASGTVAALGQSSAQIGSVVQVITGIAEQTNLLALNATIEAARAGDAGKGFAVVASEVKDLAQETSKATDDVSQRIAAIQADTEAAVTAISQISEIIARINDTQSTIASAVEEQTATTNEMSRNVTEAAAGSAAIAENITRVASAAATTTEGVAQTLTSSTGLERMSTQLSEVVSGFSYTTQVTDEEPGENAQAKQDDGNIEVAINKALRAHWGWQKRLAGAIERGAHGEDPTVVARDDRCGFGTWLYGYQPSAGDRPFYDAAKEQHAAFHLEAARTLGLVSSGRRADAQASVAKGGAFATASRVLTSTMVEWKKQSARTS
jgi:methyl-accepting chemotaxis protein